MKKFLLFLAVVAVTLTAYNVLHEYATAQRGGIEAIGGEASVFAVPFLAYGVTGIVKDMKKSKGEVQDD